MGNVTHEQANLMLRLYDPQRESRLREARKWFELPSPSLIAAPRCPSV
jgi:hypothetical protein